MVLTPVNRIDSSKQDASSSQREKCVKFLMTTIVNAGTNGIMLEEVYTMGSIEFNFDHVIIKRLLDHWVNARYVLCVPQEGDFLLKSSEKLLEIANRKVN